MARSGNGRAAGHILSNGGGHAHSGFRSMNTDDVRSEHRLPRLCAKQACSLFRFIGLKARWADRPESLCFNSAHAPRFLTTLTSGRRKAPPTNVRSRDANLVGEALCLSRP